MLFFNDSLKNNHICYCTRYLLNLPHLIFFSCVCVLSHFSHVWLFGTLWIAACQAPLSMRFFRQECWSGLPSLPPWNLPDPGIEPLSLTSPALAGGFFITSTTWELLDYLSGPWIQRQLSLEETNVVKSCDQRLQWCSHRPRRYSWSH